MDEDLGGAEGDGTSLIVDIQIVFSQDDSVGATAAWSENKHTGTRVRGASIWDLFKNYLFIQVPIQYLHFMSLYYHLTVKTLFERILFVTNLFVLFYNYFM